MGQDSVSGDETTSKLVLQLEERHAGLEVECRAENEASTEPLAAVTKLDVKLAVQQVEMAEWTTGREGELITLSCRAMGARPRPSLTWRLPAGAEQVEQEDSAEQAEDGSWDVAGQATFLATAAQHEEEVTCLASNEVMEHPMEAVTLLDIQCEC